MRSTALVLALVACGTRHDPPSPAPATPALAPAAPSNQAAPKAPAMSLEERLKTPPTDVKTLLELRDFSEADITAVLGPRVKDVGYEKLTPLDVYGDKGATTAYFFFSGPTLVMVYSGDNTYLARLSLRAIEAELGPAEKVVRSRQGKRANQHLYPRRGFAYSAEDDEVGFVEVFPPMPLGEYLTRVYDDPGEFIK